MKYEDEDILNAIRERLLRELGADTEGKSLGDTSFETILKLSKERDLLNKQLETLLSDKAKLTRASLVTSIIRDVKASICEKQLLRCLQVKSSVSTSKIKEKVDCVDLKSLKFRLNVKLQNWGCKINSFRKGKKYFYQLDIATLEIRMLSKVASN